MNPISDKELDKLFQQRFEDLEIEPSAAVWNKIAGTMDQKIKRKSVFPSFWMAAASIVVLIAAGFLYLRPQEVIKLQGSSEIALKMDDNSSRIEKSETSVLIEEPIHSPKTIETEIPEFRLVNPSGAKSGEFLPVQKAPLVEPEVTATIAPEPVVYASEPVKKINQVQPKKAVKVPNRYSGDQSALDVTQPDMLAKADLPEEETNPDAAEIRGQKKIRSIGSLVNFVIAKVDKREDKLIEFKDSDEGSEVSGINLGLLKFKSKK